MSEKYKLKKWYPSLPDDWKSVEGKLKVTNKFRGKSSNIFDIVETSHNKDCLTQRVISRAEVENNPDFWEPIEERNYEILSIKDQEKVYPFDDNYLDSMQAEIYSIKRLTDDKVFTIGDRVSLDDINKYIINNISVTTREPLVQIVRGSYSHNVSLYLLTYIEPLFKTDDRKGVYKGDRYYYVTAKFEIKSAIADNVPNNRKSQVEFKNLSEAEAWVADNKPQYSMREIGEAFNKSQIYKGNHSIKSIHMPTFRRLLEKKN